MEHESGLHESLLWTAPEILRLSPHTKMVDLPLKVLQKADIFSFGIISQEIIQQDVPYSLNEPSLPPEEIVEMLKAGVSPLLRPDLRGAVPFFYIQHF